jgi:hypothetical protein
MMGPAWIWVVYGLLMLAAGAGIGHGLGYRKGWLAAEDWATVDATVATDALPVQYGTLAEHRRWAEAHGVVEQPGSAGYIGRHAAGIAPGNDAQNLAIDAQLSEWTAGCDRTGELARILAEPDPDALIIESPTGFAAWLAQTGQPWSVEELTEAAT